MSDKNKKNIFTKHNYLNVSVLFFKNLSFSKVSPLQNKTSCSSFRFSFVQSLSGFSRNRIKWI
jgi:hypothetical protein